jgi:hypothetical protein
MITVKAVRKIAREKGIGITTISVTRRDGNMYLEMTDLPRDMIERNLRNDGRGNTVEVDRAIRKYNRQARKLSAALRKNGIMLWGRCWGSGAWGYTTRKPTYMDELATNNID